MRENDRVERRQEPHRCLHARVGERRARHVVERPALVVLEGPQADERRVDLSQPEAGELHDVVA